MIYGGLFDVDKKQIRIGELELTIKKEDFWSSVGYKDVLMLDMVIQMKKKKLMIV